MRGLNCAGVTISNATYPHALREAARKGASTRDTNYLRTKLGYRVTGQTVKSYYILGSLRETAVCSKFSGKDLDLRCVPLARLSLRLFFHTSRVIRVLGTSENARPLPSPETNSPKHTVTFARRSE